jgi:hypothetical protein
MLSRKKGNIPLRHVNIAITILAATILVIVCVGR